MCEVHKPEKTEELLRAFFFEAMQQGYAVSPPKTPIPSLPGSKSIRYERGGLLLVDFWFASSSSEFSHGMTVIFCEERPMWAMHYGGWYREDAISFLKQALLAAYSVREFSAGRGPERFSKDGWIYYNEFHGYGADPLFAKFEGRESVLDKGGHLAGVHNYFGGLMV